MKFSSKGEICIVSRFKPYAEELSIFIKEFGLFDTIKEFEDQNDLLRYIQNSETLKERFLLIEASPNDYLSENALKSIREYSLNTKVIYIITMTSPFHLRSLFDYKPDGMIHKAERQYEVIKCIINLRKGITYYSSFMKDFINPSTLRTEADIEFTSREVELLTFWASNHSMSQTAQLVNLSHHTVVSHRRNMFKKANCNSIEELIEIAQELELI